MHERVGVRMAVETFGVGNFNATENELAPGDQLMNVIADANVNHVRTVCFFCAAKKKFSLLNRKAAGEAMHDIRFYQLCQQLVAQNKIGQTSSV
jgi:hypothetical protein